MEEKQNERLLRTTEVAKMVGLSRVTLWRLEREGRFPLRRRLTENTVAWLESEVVDWMRKRPAAVPESA